MYLDKRTRRGNATWTKSTSGSRTKTRSVWPRQKPFGFGWKGRRLSSGSLWRETTRPCRYFYPSLSKIFSIATFDHHDCDYQERLANEEEERERREKELKDKLREQQEESSNEIILLHKRLAAENNKRQEEIEELNRR